MSSFIKKAPFVTVEGVDGAGKSSHIAAIVESLKQAGWDVVSTREPGGTPLCERLRDMILNDSMELKTEILLAFASRSEHLDRVIRPALAQGVAVVCDRFTDSTFAYQVGGRQGPASLVQALEASIHGDLQPDLTLLFDLPVSMSMERLSLTGKVADKFESQPTTFFENVRDGYLQRVEQDNVSRFSVIDSSVPLVQVKAAVAAVMEDFVAQHPAFEVTNSPRSAPSRRPRR